MANHTNDHAETTPRIERIKVKNFRALRDVEIKKVTPLTVLLGPNGSGKSTLFDVFAFLAECFESGLRRAWDKRGRAKELKSRDSKGPIVIEIAYREQHNPKKSPLITYHLEIDEQNYRPVVCGEWLRWTRSGKAGRPFKFLEYSGGQGQVVSGELPDDEDKRIEVPLSSSDTLAVNALGQLAENPRVVALRNFIMGWHVSYLSSDDARGQPESGPQERLNKSGDNLANVIQYLSEEHPEHLEEIFQKLRLRIPVIQEVTAHPMQDGRLLLKIMDAPFAEPVLARFASDGTLKMLCYLILLHDPNPPPFIGIEEPENFLHPRILYSLAEECRAAADNTQILVTTHSPFFLNALKQEEVRVFWRDETGYTKCQSLSDKTEIRSFLDAGASLGDLWMEGYFGVGDPLTRMGVASRSEGGS
ncbi:AAA family ATPase [Ruegeria sp.]|uniref:AAA family ATPase n=1 Tax=Ruegeria sp. TaxID=1879320 RepID=UPI003AFF939B